MTPMCNRPVAKLHNSDLPGGWINAALWALPVTGRIESKVSPRGVPGHPACRARDQGVLDARTSARGERSTFDGQYALLAPATEGLNRSRVGASAYPRSCETKRRSGVITNSSGRWWCTTAKLHREFRIIASFRLAVALPAASGDIYDRCDTVLRS